MSPCSCGEQAACEPGVASSRYSAASTQCSVPTPIWWVSWGITRRPTGRRYCRRCRAASSSPPCHKASAARRTSRGAVPPPPAAAEAGAVLGASQGRSCAYPPPITQCGELPRPGGCRGSAQALHRKSAHRLLYSYIYAGALVHVRTWIHYKCVVKPARPAGRARAAPPARRGAPPPCAARGSAGTRGAAGTVLKRVAPHTVSGAAQGGVCGSTG